MTHVPDGGGGDDTDEQQAQQVQHVGRRHEEDLLQEKRVQLRQLKTNERKMMTEGKALSTKRPANTGPVERPLGLGLTTLSLFRSLLK